ncbi:MAG: carboxylesterase/lipase family protein [Bryobacteraceae bacterium]
MRLCALLLASVASCAFAALTNAVRIESGPIEGVPALVPGVMAFEGIPYAAPPLGDLRWKPPKPPVSWPGVRNADRYGPACPQRYMGPDSVAFFGDYEFKSEDCLYANVWTPAKTANDRLPVLVWIHGGGYRYGSGAERIYHGDHLAARGVVLVTFNYRLGIFGFLAHPELTRESGHRASGNYGLMDQAFALEWVKRNIAAFGGDPNRITIFGQSAGCGSVSYMQATPLAKGLFQHVIGESCGTSFIWRNVRRLAAAEQDGVRFAAAVGAPSLAALRKLPTDALLNAWDQAGNASGPIVDGYVVPEDVYLIFAKGAQNPADVIVGSTEDEGTSLRRPRPKLDTPADQAEMDALYPPGNDEKIVDDDHLWSAYTWARLNSKSGSHKSFQYFFSHHPPFPQPYSQFAHDVTKLGAYHTAEIIYVFNNLDIRRTRSWPYTAYDQQLADIMSSYWVNFAATGNPNGRGVPNWPAFDDAKPRVMHFGDKVAAMPLPREAEVKFWDKVNLKPYRNQ